MIYWAKIRSSTNLHNKTGLTPPELDSDQDPPKNTTRSLPTSFRALVRTYFKILSGTLLRLRAVVRYFATKFMLFREIFHAFCCFTDKIPEVFTVNKNLHGKQHCNEEPEKNKFWKILTGVFNFRRYICQNKV